MSLKTAKALAKLLDSQFEILGIKFGLDPLLDVIPGLGDVVAVLLALYILKVGYDMKLPQDKIAQMIGNIVIDFLIGMIPGIGAVATVFYRSNLKNIEIIEKFKNLDIEEGEVIS